MTDPKDELITNIDAYKEHLKPFTETFKLLMENEKPIFKEDIINNFNETIKWTLAQKLSENLHITIESAIIEIENLDLREYLK